MVVGVHAGVQRLVREAVEDGRLPRLAGRHCGGWEGVGGAGEEAGVWLEGAFPPRRPPVVRPATAECGGGGSLLQEKRAGWTPPSWDAPGLARNQVRNASNKCKYGQMGQPAGRQTCFCQARCQTNGGGDHNQTVLFSPPCRIPPTPGGLVTLFAGDFKSRACRRERGTGKGRRFGCQAEVGRIQNQ